jgi:hypothetical protein
MSSSTASTRNESTTQQLQASGNSQPAVVSTPSRQSQNRFQIEQALASQLTSSQAASVSTDSTRTVNASRASSESDSTASSSITGRHQQPQPPDHSQQQSQ